METNGSFNKGIYMAQNITTLNEIRARQDSQESKPTPELNDLIYAVKGSGSDRDKAYTIQELRVFFTTNPDMFKVGTSEWKNVQGTGPTIVGLAALSAGVIEALMEFVVGESKWERGDNKPTISGLYGLESGNVGTTNLQADTIDAHGEGVTSIQVNKRLVRNNAPGQENEPLLLGPTQVGGRLKVTGSLDAFGGLTLTNHIWNASAADIVDKMKSLGNGQVAIIFNSSSSDVSFPATTGSPNPRSFSVPHDASVLIVKSGDRIYPAGGILV